MDIVVKELGHGRYSASVDGRLVVSSSRTPFFAAARELMGENVDPDTVVVLVRAGTSVGSLRAKLRVAACMTVVENDKSGPRLAEFAERPLDSLFPLLPKSASGRSEILAGAVPETEIAGL